MSEDAPEQPTGKPQVTKPAAKPCPICGRPALEPFRPFCSKRCADIDLNRWLGGVYAIPASEEDDMDRAPDE